MGRVGGELKTRVYRTGDSSDRRIHLSRRLTVEGMCSMIEMRMAAANISAEIVSPGSPSIQRTQRQLRFLAAFAECGRVISASRAARVHRSSHYVWMRTDPTYPARFNAAREMAGTMLHDEAVERAVHGMRVPVLYKGRPVRINGKVLYRCVYSERLLIHLLETCDPEKFGRRAENRRPVPSQ